MSFPTVARVLLLFTVCTALGCAHARQPKAAPGQVNASVHVGNITLLNTEEHYVLIDGGSLPAPAEGATLKTYRNGEPTGELVATSIRRRPFIIADIRQGDPQKGDRVEMPRFLESAAPAATPAPAGNSAPDASGASTDERAFPSMGSLLGPQ